jgi:hypothetical protein
MELFCFILLRETPVRTSVRNPNSESPTSSLSVPLGAAAAGVPALGTSPAWSLLPPPPAAGEAAPCSSGGSRVAGSRPLTAANAAATSATVSPVADTGRCGVGEGRAAGPCAVALGGGTLSSPGAGLGTPAIGCCACCVSLRLAYRPSAGCSAVDAAALPRGGGCRRHRLDVSCFRVVNRNDSIPNPLVPFSRANGGAQPSGGMMCAMPYAAANGVILEMYAMGLANSSGVGRNEGAVGTSL